MSKIIADCGELIITVEETENGIIVYDTNRKLKLLKEIFDRYIPLIEPIGGTFYPEKDTMLGYYFLLKEGLYSNMVKELTIEGDIGEIPHEEGRIY